MYFRILHVALTAYLFTVLSGCFYGVDERPAEWSPTEIQAGTSGCPDISGHYENIGISSTENRTVHLSTLILAILLSGESYSEELQYTYSQHPDLISSINIRQTGSNQLQVTAYSPYLQIEIDKILSHDKGDFECTEDGVVLKWSEHLFWLISAGFRQHNYVLNRTNDGSLLIKADVWIAAYHVFVPLGGHIGNWILFKECCSNMYKESAIGKYLAACKDMTQYHGTEWCSQNLEKYAKDYDNAKKLRREAGAYCPNAELGHADAQRHVGDLYYHGLPPLNRNPVEAYVWYARSAAGGDVEAKDLLKRVTFELSRDQLSKAKNRLANWAPGNCITDLIEAGSTTLE